MFRIGFVCVASARIPHVVSFLILVDCFVSDSTATNSLRFARSSTAAFGRGSFLIEWLTAGCYTNVSDWFCVISFGSDSSCCNVLGFVDRFVSNLLILLLVSLLILQQRARFALLARLPRPSAAAILYRKVDCKMLHECY